MTDAATTTTTTTTTTGNRVMLLTPPGGAAVAVVRLSGAGVGAFLREHFSKPVPPGRCVHGTLRGRSAVIDDPVVVRVGDDAVDLNLHGGTWVINATIDLARANGFELIAAAEDATASSVDASSALEAEVLSSLPQARTELAIRALLAQPAAWERVRRAAAAAPSPDVFAGTLSDRSLSRLLDPPRAAIVGAANVGKSTLANQLFAQERSITADVPGTTRDWVGAIANIDGLAVMLIDTPGQRATDDGIEQVAIARSGEQVRQADLVILVLDAARPLEPDQQPLVNRFPSAIRVVNRIDLPHAWNIGRIGGISTIALRGEGVDDLRQAILRHFDCADLDLGKPRIWTRRQRAIIERAIRDPSALLQL